MTATPPPMPEPSFRLSWSAAGYRVSEPNINDTDVYTLEQIQARDAQWMERITALEADRKMLREALKRARIDSLNMSIADQQFITAALEATHD